METSLQVTDLIVLTSVAAVGNMIRKSDGCASLQIQHVFESFR